MTNTDDKRMFAHVRRLSSKGDELYVRLGKDDIARLGLVHGQPVELIFESDYSVTGLVKTTGSAPWLAPDRSNSNAEITAVLRTAGFEHGDDAVASLRDRGECERESTSLVEARSSDFLQVSIDTNSRHFENARFDSETAVAAVRSYNSESYRGQANVDIDRIAYARFKSGIPSDESELVELVRFVGDEYGGAQRRFLPHGYRAEAVIIVSNLSPVLDRWRSAILEAPSIMGGVVDEATLKLLFDSFVGTKRWPVWASKTLHFARPDAFPILDSKAKKALGLASLGSSPRNYLRFCSAFRDAMLANPEALKAARVADNGESPSDLKLLDKILFQLG